MTWFRGGKPRAIAELRRLGLTPSPADFPPPLQWEQTLWDWYLRLGAQVRVGPLGPIGLDYGVWLPVIEHQGWDLETAFELLSAIELARFSASPEPREHDTRH